MIRALTLASLLPALCGCIPTMSSPVEYDAKPISPETGEEYFLHTGGGDPYASGMAYPVFLALMEAYPDLLGRDWNELADKFGMNRDPEAKGNPQALPIGFHLTTDPNSKVPWLVANCQMCHSERIRLTTGDVVVPGLGSKRIRPHAYLAALAQIGMDPGLDVSRIEALADERAAAWHVPWPANVGTYIVRSTVSAMQKGAGARAAAQKRFDGALPGRMATIESFALALDAYREQPIALNPTIGWAKVPDVVGFPFRETFSYDASGYGSPQALVLEADFLFGARPEWYLSHPHIATGMYMYLKDFDRELPFPGPIDASLAARGKQAFTESCARCHGDYVKRGNSRRVAYEERVIPKSIIGTDPARTDAVTPDFVDAANGLPLTRGFTAVRNTGGYVPPVLLDVWARGLYGHAGQWPSLEVMALPPEQRPHKFIVDTNGLYDLNRVGVRYEAVTTPRALRPGEYLYDGEQPGLHEDGHPFLSSLSASDRRAVIEYLKTL